MPLNEVAIEEQYYILAASDLPAERALVLKQDDTFALFDRFGDIDSKVSAGEGLYHKGTRLFPGPAPLADVKSPVTSVTRRELENIMLNDLNDAHLMRHASEPAPSVAGAASMYAVRWIRSTATCGAGPLSGLYSAAFTDPGEN